MSDENGRVDIDLARSRVLPTSAFVPAAQHQLNFTESCIFRAGMAGAAGGAMGLLFGMFMTSAGPHPVDAPADKFISREILRQTMKDMGQGMKSYSKTFGVCGLVFSASECVIEKTVAQHNMYTVMSSGCVAGAVLGVNGGPYGMATGCAGFAAFSALIEHFMSDFF